MRKAIWTIGYVLSFIAAVAAIGYVGLRQSTNRIMSPAPPSVTASVVPIPPRRLDFSKPTVAILLGNTVTETTDFLAPYAMFSESGAYNVYAVAESRALRTLTGGLDVVPQVSFGELDAQLPQGPDIIVVPAIGSIGSPANVPLLNWLRREGRSHALLFSWCEGAEVLAASGLIDGKNVTTHWGAIDRIEHDYPAAHWQRGVRYVDSGSVLTTAGLTSGIDATLHLLERRNGPSIAAKVAEAFHIPDSPFVSNPRMKQYSPDISDANVLLNLAFAWPRHRTGVPLDEGIDEFNLSAAIDVYQATDQIYTISGEASAVSRHGLQFVPRFTPGSSPGMDRMLETASSGFAFQTALEDIAHEHDQATAAFTARRLEVRSPLNLSGPRWPLPQLLALLLSGLTGVVALAGSSLLLRRTRSKG